ncbi:MAG: hypothetical protein JXB39_02910 [Deltaproteobacteria bacterium]|nr:hypothetical protein [Deltaproteobacteria bacterium]
MRLALFALGLAACDDGGTPAYDPYAECMEDAQARCCANADCAGDDVCWFSYICSASPEGGRVCSAPEGDRACHPQCVDGTCEDDLTCTEIEIFPGTDYGQTYDLCL